MEIQENGIKICEEIILYFVTTTPFTVTIRHLKKISIKVIWYLPSVFVYVRQRRRPYRIIYY